MNQAVVATIAASIAVLIGAAIALASAFVKDRANPAHQIAQASAATTESILSTLLPLSERVTTIEAEVRVLHSYIDLLRHQIRSLGAEPLPWPAWPAPPNPERPTPHDHHQDLPARPR
jgi:hypothetical protein